MCIYYVCVYIMYVIYEYTIIYHTYSLLNAYTRLCYKYVVSGLVTLPHRYTHRLTRV